MTTVRTDDLTDDFFTSAESPLVVVSPGAGTILRANDALRAIARSGPIEGEPFVSLLHDEDRAAGTLALASLEAGKGTVFDGRFAIAEGTSDRVFQFQATRGATMTLVVGLDVTGQRAIERELREKLAIIERQNETMQMFSRVLENAPVVLWSIDAEGVYTMSEGKGLDLIGFRGGESVGINALEMYQGHSELARALTQALSGEDVRVVASAAPGVFFETWCVPLRGPNGDVRGVMGFGIDASERVKSELELREKLELIERQSATIRSLATPIIQVWDEVLCLPVIGTVDSARTADMMQGLLEAIVREQARFAIVDLTGVEVVDTSTADHLIQLFRAAKVLGVEGILCGIRPAVAQTIVALGLELGTVRTMRSLRDALKWCIRSTEARARTVHANGHGHSSASASSAANASRGLAALAK